MDLAALAKLFTPINSPNPGDGSSSYLVSFAIIGINILLTLAGVVTVVAIVWGGILYISSAGDEAKAKKGRQAAINGLIGMMIVILSFTMIEVIGRILS
ncbi:MAG: hypothetical protein WC773_03430 [Patescibacteria group bacterium]|jgi:hypothetical protein